MSYLGNVDFGIVADRMELELLMPAPAPASKAVSARRAGRKADVRA